MIIISSNTDKYDYDSYDIYRSLIRDYLLKYSNFSSIKLQMLFRCMKDNELYKIIHFIRYPKFKSLCINLPNEYNDIKIKKQKYQYHISIYQVNDEDIDNETIFKVFSSGNIQNINYLLKNNNIDFNMVNDNNETLLEVLPYDTNLINIYYNMFYQFYIKNVDTNKQQIDVLKKENQELIKKIEKQKNSNKISYYVYFLIIFIPIIYFLFGKQYNSFAINIPLEEYRLVSRISDSLNKLYLNYSFVYYYQLLIGYEDNNCNLDDLYSNYLLE